MTGWLDRPFSVDRLIDAAHRRTGLRDFGDLGFTGPLQTFLDACRQEANLGVIGRIATHWDVVRFLSSLLALQEAEKRAPAIREQAIEAPIFITGLPRTGTTFLSRMLMQDRRNLTPRIWQTIYPYPVGRVRSPDQARATVNAQLRAFARLAPDFPPLHPVQADSPQECSEITAHVFRSLRLDTTYQIPSYRSWLDRTGHLEAYRFHKRFLQHLQHQADPEGTGGGRWILKCPDHVFALDAIHAVYPDARIVFVHRDPVRVLPSVARLTEVLRRPFSRYVDPLQIGVQEAARWVAGAEAIMAESRRERFARPIFHVFHQALIANPTGTIAALYDHLDLPLDAETADRIRASATRAPRGGYNTPRYKLADHGLKAPELREQFRAYTAYFGVDAEAPTG